MAVEVATSNVGLLTFAFLLLTVEKVACDDVTVGAEPVARKMQDSEPETNVIIPNPIDIIREEGIIYQWSAYMVDKDGCVRLQAWRPSRDVLLMTTPRRPTYRGTTPPPSARHSFWILLGETDCVISERANQSINVNIPKKEAIRVERNDVIGFRYDRSNPVPYEVRQSCEIFQRSKQITLVDLEDRTLNAEELYGFNSFPECRMYSLKASIRKNSCSKLQARDVVQNHTYLSMDNFDDQCWIIKAPSSYRSPSTVLYIQIDDLGLKHTGECNHGYLEIREGTTSTSQHLRRECEMPITMDIRPITSGKAYIRLKRLGGPTQNARISFRYSTNRGLLGKGCTPVVVGQNPSYIQSPNFPRHYPANSNFCWDLIVPVGEERIRLEVPTGLDLQPPVGCRRTAEYSYCSGRHCRDFIEIRDGGQHNSPLLNKWCDHTGNDLVETSSGQTMRIDFISDASVQGTGFRMKIYAVHPEAAYCTHLTALMTPNTVQSHNYPFFYLKGRDDCWSIRTIDDQDRIIVTIHDSSLEPDILCNKDWIEVRDGPGRDAPILRRWCGKTIPSQIITSGPNLFIRFVSDFHYQAPGFSLDYKQTNSEACTTYYANTFSESIELKSNGVGNGIQVKCVIFQSEADRVKLKWDTEADSTDSAICGNNYVEVLDGGSPNAKLLGRYCSSVPIPSQGVTSTGNALYVRWVSDPNTKHSSVKLSHVSLSTGHCQTLLASASRQLIIATELLHGTTTRPSRGGRGTPPLIDRAKSRPDPVEPCDSCIYAANEKRCWLFETKRGIGKLLFEVKFLELQDSDQGGKCLDYIEVFDGKTAGHGSFGKRCGRQLPFNITTTGSVGFLQFTSDDTMQYRGYRILVSAIYEDECTKLDVRPYRYDLRSPGFPATYPVNMEKCWLVQGPSSRNPIQLLASTLLLGKDDILEIYDGPNIEANQLKVWNHSTPQGAKVTSEGRSLTIIFKSGPLSTGIGRFSLAYQWIFSERCEHVSLGNDLYSPNTSYITSPGYGETGYKSNDFACWVVTAVLPHHQVRVYIDYFLLEDSNKCSADLMEIYDGPSSDADLLQRWCGEMSKRLLAHSTGRSLYIRFSSDDENNYRGFKLKLSTYSTSTIQNPAGGKSDDGIDLTKRDLALIVIILIVLLVIILVIVLVVKCRRKKTNYNNEQNVRPPPTIVYTNQPPAYQGPYGATGGILGEERKEPLPPDLPDLQAEPEQDDNAANDISTETPPPTPTQNTFRDKNTLL